MTDWRQQMIARLTPDGCTCTWGLETEFLAGEPAHGLVLEQADRRCAVHGKPRHKTIRKETR